MVLPAVITSPVFQTTPLTSADIETTQTITETSDNTNAVLVSGDTISYSNVGITKTGDGSGGEDADFYGTNAAVLATNGASLTLTGSLVVTDGAYANGVFSYGSGTTVNVKDSVIITRSNNSGGIMTTGGGTTNAEKLTIETSGGSSAATPLQGRDHRRSIPQQILLFRMHILSRKLLRV